MARTAEQRYIQYEIQWRAHASVAKAVKLGHLPKIRTLQCVDCSAVAQCFDHRDYAEPLHVEPVCDSCNRVRGVAKQATLDDLRRVMAWRASGSFESWLRDLSEDRELARTKAAA